MIVELNKLFKYLDDNFYDTEDMDHIRNNVEDLNNDPFCFGENGVKDSIEDIKKAIETAY